MKTVNAIFIVKVSDIEREEVEIEVPDDATPEEIDAIVAKEYSEFVGNENSGGWMIAENN